MEYPVLLSRACRASVTPKNGRKHRGAQSPPVLRLTAWGRSRTHLESYERTRQSTIYHLFIPYSLYEQASIACIIPFCHPFYQDPSADMAPNTTPVSLSDILCIRDLGRAAPEKLSKVVTGECDGVTIVIRRWLMNTRIFQRRL